MFSWLLQKQREPTKKKNHKDSEFEALREDSEFEALREHVFNLWEQIQNLDKNYDSGLYQVSEKDFCNLILVKISEFTSHKWFKSCDSVQCLHDSKVNWYTPILASNIAEKYEKILNKY